MIRIMEKNAISPWHKSVRGNFLAVAARMGSAIKTGMTSASQMIRS